MSTYRTARPQPSSGSVEIEAQTTRRWPFRGPKGFGPVQALTRISFDVPPGQVTALAGDNGAGKSVTIKTIAGLWQADEGEILWEGQPLHFHGPRDAEAQGITTIYQDLALCDNLDIVQNMFLGHEVLRHRLLDEGSMELTAKKTLEDLFSHHDPLDPPAGGVTVWWPATVGRRRQGGHVQKRSS